MIQIRNISKTFRQKDQPFKALDNINLQISEGDIVGIIGSSGAGKSTLIRCVNLLEKPDTGQIIVNGIDLTVLPSKQLAAQRKKIGMIFQHFNLLSSRTVYGNIALPLELDNVPQHIIREKVTELLQIVGLEEKANEYPRSLSGGQKQRVAIARALANDPYLLLCDEATSALDPATTQSILELLRDINRRLKLTILLITHEMDVVKSICNQIAVIDHGKLVAEGTLEQLLTDRNHPVINRFINTGTITLPHEIYINMKQEQAEGLTPLIELELTGNIAFDELIDTVYNKFKIPYKLIKADIEYLGRASFGKLLLHLKGNKETNDRAVEYFNQRKIKNELKGYA
ncbi:ATP-binding cassette domain-containing protein [Pseudoflavitalea sp. G-6-1-2]|uniref:methionine ABC transporter ATP-binding protein n=1 Tax=Pseudoflavitalea sp. G-6-1-2 TaxID=2728841 RepID=UPI00146B4142|nr:ATP-binding cassette domain-containing protein [Pseudoflavitalea sp. G-6-1-2]NML22357.1 ATP-binding cassette domain-containing protein [Pseudoflavitalea sp. G-6-1-2]